MVELKDVHQMVRLERKIEGISAVLLPFTQSGQIDFSAFDEHLERTVRAGLIPAVNMDTGYVNLITHSERREILERTQAKMAGRKFIAGAYIEGDPGETGELYLKAVEEIQLAGGIPILFQCSAFKAMPFDDLLKLYQQVSLGCYQLLAFELGEMFAPFGQIYTLEFFSALMEIPQIIGIKHSSLDREQEWARLHLRDQKRPDFRIYTGNDLAIDMVMYGSDYLLGLSTFAPDLFAKRDAYWQAGDSRFYAFNDLLQYLGHFAFRQPVPAYKHSAAQFLKLRGWLKSDEPHPLGQRRMSSDEEILKTILISLEAL